MKNKRIWLSLAKMSDQEQHYVQEAFDTNWVVPLGTNVDAFVVQPIAQNPHENSNNFKSQSIVPKFL